MRKILALALTVLTVFCLAAPARAERLVLTDMAGREVSLEGPARRIVALQPGDCEILFAIGAGGLLVGRGEYCNYPEEVIDLPSAQSGFEINVEQIIALEPDVVIMTKMAQREEDAKKLEEARISVIISDAQTIGGVYAGIELLGRVTGFEEEAGRLIGEMQASFAQIKEKAGGTPGGSIYFEASPLEYGLWTAGAGTFMDEIAQMLNLANAFADLTGWQPVSEEQVISRDPDYIVTTAIDFGLGLTPVEEVLSRPGWSGMKAVKSGKVFNADADAITRPGPRLAEAARDLYDFIYGQ